MGAPDIQPIASVVITNDNGDVLLVRYAPDDPRLWLPGADLEPYEHPDEAAARALADLRGLSIREQRLSHVESFRGRRGWHLVFHYLTRVDGEPAGELEATWANPEDLPRTAHGRWERDAIARALSAAA